MKTVGKQIRERGEETIRKSQNNLRIRESHRQERHYTNISEKRQHNERREYFYSPLCFLIMSEGQGIIPSKTLLWL